MSYNYQDAPRESQQEYFGKVHTDNKETLYNVLKRIEELEKENAELKELKKKKEEIDIMTNFCKTCKKMHTDQLTKAKEIIRAFITLDYIQLSPSDRIVDLRDKAEQFIKEIK